MNRFLRCDRIYIGLATLLTANIVVARVVNVGIQPWEKLALVFIYWVLAVVIPALARSTGRLSPTGISALQSIFLLPFWAVLICFEHSSIVPRLPALMVLALLTALMNRGSSSWLISPFLAFSSVLAAILLLDLIWGAPVPKVILERQPEIIAIPDPGLGYKPIPSLHATIRAWHGDSVLYQINYDFDEYSRRIVPQTAQSGGQDTALNSSRRRHAIFMGGSGVFGENIDNQETLAAHFAQLAPDYHVYNYAFSGYGPQQMYEQLRSPGFRSQISEPSGILIYGFIPDHIRRANGTYVTTNWGSWFPRYEVRKGQLGRLGTFAETQRFKLSFFNLLRSSRSLDRLAAFLDNALSYRAGQWSVFLSLVEASQRRYLRIFQGEFYAFLWPHPPGPFDAIADSLEARGITALDLGAFGCGLPGATDRVPFDAHPSGQYNVTVARALSRAIHVGQLSAATGRDLN